MPVNSSLHSSMVQEILNIVNEANNEGILSSVSGGGGGYTIGRLITSNDTPIHSDSATMLLSNTASAHNITISNDATSAWVTDDKLAVMQLGAGLPAFVAGSGVTLRTPAGYTGSAIYVPIYATRIAANEWVVS